MQTVAPTWSIEDTAAGFYLREGPGPLGGYYRFGPFTERRLAQSAMEERQAAVSAITQRDTLHEPIAMDGARRSVPLRKQGVPEISMVDDLHYKIDGINIDDMSRDQLVAFALRICRERAV